MDCYCREDEHMMGYTLAKGFGVGFIPGSPKVIETPSVRTHYADLEINIQEGRINWALLDQGGTILHQEDMGPVVWPTVISPRFTLDGEELVKLRLICLSGNCKAQGFISKGEE